MALDVFGVSKNFGSVARNIFSVGQLIPNTRKLELGENELFGGFVHFSPPMLWVDVKMFLFSVY